MDLSVSIVNTNSRELLLACLESLAGTEAEIVVLDNASEDGSAAAVRERFPQVRVIEQQHRAGFGANHNTVIRATTGRYVYVLNEDTTADDWSFERITEYLDAHPQVAALGPRLVYPDGRLQDSAWRFPTPLVSTMGLATLGQARRQAVERCERPAGGLGDGRRARACAVRRSTRSGCSTRSFFLYSEEVDLQARLRQAGWETHYFPELDRRPPRVAVQRRHPRAAHQRDVAQPAPLLAEAPQPSWVRVLPHSPPEASTPPVRCCRRSARRDPGIEARMRLHARDAWRVEGPGLRELADEWNGRVGSTPPG